MPKTGMEPARRAQAINAALECISEVGIDSVTLDMVAKKAGFSKGILAYYFKSKRQLILESFTAFFQSDGIKIKSALSRAMSPEKMLKTVVQVSLPPIDDNNSDPLNVSSLDGADKINLPQATIARLFAHYTSKAAIDPEFSAIIKEVYRGDVAGISSLVAYAKGSSVPSSSDSNSAYMLLALIYGLSFFRITGFFPENGSDNRDIAFGCIDLLLK